MNGDRVRSNVWLLVIGAGVANGIALNLGTGVSSVGVLVGLLIVLALEVVAWYGRRYMRRVPR